MHELPLRIGRPRASMPGIERHRVEGTTFATLEQYNYVHDELTNQT